MIVLRRERDGWFGHLRHDAAYQTARGDVVRGASLQHGQPTLDGRHPRNAPLSPQRPRNGPSTLRTNWRTSFHQLINSFTTSYTWICIAKRASSLTSFFQGQATDIMIHAEEILKLKRLINNLYVHHTGQSYEVIGESDCETHAVSNQSR